MTSNSQKPQDNTALFALCAQEWNSCDEESQRTDENTKKNKDNVVELSNSTLSANEQTKLESVAKGAGQKQQIEKNASLQVSSCFTRFYASLYASVQKAICCSLNMSGEIAKKLVKNPEEALHWHICLHNQGKNTNEKALVWLKNGMDNGWLRYVSAEEVSTPLHNAYLSQEKFWQRFSSLCACKRGRLSLILFRIPQKNLQMLSMQERNTHNAYLRELIEQILLVVKDEDVFGEVEGFGLALALTEHGSFSATACAERILRRLEAAFEYMPTENNFDQLPRSNKLGLVDHEHQANHFTQLNQLIQSLQIAVAEMEDGENADTLFAHAKEVCPVSSANLNTTHAFNRDVVEHSIELLDTSKNSTIQSYENALEHPHKKAKIAKMRRAEITDLARSSVHKVDQVRVHVYRHNTKEKEKKSLVQSDEKRFLFFGVQ